MREATAATAASRSRACCSTPPRELGIDLARSFMVGDRGATSRRAARPAAGPCSSISITRRAAADRTRTVIVRSLAEAADVDSAAALEERSRAHDRASTDLKIKIFADGADLAGHRRDVRRTRCIKGFTTNPTLMRKAGDRRLRGLRPRGARRRPGPADLVRGVRRRFRRDGARRRARSPPGARTSTSRSR